MLCVVKQFKIGDFHLKMGLLIYLLLLNCMICLSTENEVVEQHLPNYVIPQNYRVNLKLDPGFNESFSGAVKIIIYAKEDVDKIVLHASDTLDLHSISVKEIKDYTKSELADYWDITKNDSLSIYLTKTMNKGKLYVMRFRYDGMFTENFGLIIRSHESEDGTKDYLIANHFETIFARQAFPCFDEPRFRTKFTIIIKHPVEYTALSNMEVKESTPLWNDNSWMETEFKPTPKMPTYLVGILVSKYNNYNNLKQGPKIYEKLIEIYSYNNSEYQNNLTIVAAQKYLMEMERYLDFPYQLPKLTIAFVPDFPQGGMEYWGLIIYNENVLNGMLKEGCVEYCKLTYLQFIFHEIAHMWFGNEATIYDWRSLWTKEGFAQYFQFKVFDFINEYRFFFDEAYTNKIFYSMYTEYSNGISLSSEIDISEHISTWSQLIFCYYTKGSSIVRMIQRTIGEILFQQTMRHYIQTYSRRSVRSENIIEEFQKTTNYSLPVGMFESWINNKGLPLVHAYQRPNSNIVDIFQTTFNSSDELEEGTWYIPLIWTTKSNPDFTNTTVQMWLKPYENISIILDNENDWFILNIQQTGYYRVIYDDGNWKKISRALREENFSGIDPVTRTQLINDVFANAKHDHNLYIYAFEILKYVKNEYEILPWKWIQFYLEDTLDLMRLSEYSGLYEIFVQNSIENQLKYFMNTSNYRSDILKEDLLLMGCKVKSEYALKYFRKHLDDQLYFVDPTSDHTCCGIYNSNSERLFAISKKLKRSEDIIHGYSNWSLCSNNAHIIKKFYMRTIDPGFYENNRRMNKIDLITHLSEIQHPLPETLMDFMIDQFGKMEKMFDVDILKKFLKNLKNQRNSEEYRNKLTIFYNKYFKWSKQYQALKQSIEDVIAENSNNTEKTKMINSWLINNTHD